MTVCAELYHMPAARTQEQREKMRELTAAGVCIYCPETDGAHRQEAVHVGEWWWVTRNAYPYAGLEHHYLIIATPHVTSFEELPDQAGAELWAIKRMLSKRHDAPATATVERSGDMALNGSSVAHLHVHFGILPAVPGDVVRFRVSGRTATNENEATRTKGRT